MRQKYYHLIETHFGNSLIQFLVFAVWDKWKAILFHRRFFLQLVMFITAGMAFSFDLEAQEKELTKCNIVWESQSASSAESMPCGGGDIGLNVWTEKGDILFYLSKSGTFDENNGFLKLGRFRIKLTPNPFEGTAFRQELMLKEGYVKITGSNGKTRAEIIVWVDVFNPVVHLDINSNKAIQCQATYESWRYKDRAARKGENNANSYKWANQEVKTYKDEIAFRSNQVLFYHKNNPGPSIFDLTVKQQGMDSVKSQMFDPLKDLIFGGMMEGRNMLAGDKTSGTYIDTDYEGWTLKSRSASSSHKVNIYLHTAQLPSLTVWQDGLQKLVSATKGKEKTAFAKSAKWWQEFWAKSFVFINHDSSDTSSEEWQAGRNYQLFRYMLGCNAFGNYPTKFNGGLFTYDPSLIHPNLKFTPDFRNWGGGLMTAQNQRLVYFPMLKSGDFEMMESQFRFYLRSLKNAELRSQVYWNHAGACFAEQIENFGLPNYAEYGLSRPPWSDKGVEYNAWLEYTWDTVLEFCFMMLEQERYAKKDISPYLDFIESCLEFFPQHYQYLAKLRGAKSLDQQGHLILYPGSAAETYKMTYNSTTTISGLQTVISMILKLPAKYLNEQKRKHWDSILRLIPPLPFDSFEGHQTLAPARLWERINNVESPQLYPVFPWGIYGTGKPGLDIAVNTWQYDTNVVKFRSHVGWKQDNIFAARLRLTKEAARLNLLKMKDSGRRFPAFWGPGFDWTPDHNWGGSGMIGLQEMLLQTNEEKIYLLPAWPKDWDVHFKLHAPYETTVECVVKHGKVESLIVVPESRRKDVVNMF